MEEPNYGFLSNRNDLGKGTQLLEEVLQRLDGEGINVEVICAVGKEPVDDVEGHIELVETLALNNVPTRYESGCRIR